MNETVERIISGYCKADNKVRRILCEFSESELGLSLESMDCDHLRCDNATGCDLVKAALALEDEW